MQAVIQANEAFQYTAEVRPLAALPGTFSLTFWSIFAGASDPKSRVVFQTTLHRAGLLAMRELISSEVA